MISDFPIIFSWWLLLLLLGIFSLPLTLYLFNKFWDKGYALSKIIAALFVSYFVWLLGSLKLVPFNQKTAWGIIACLGIVNLAILKYQIARNARFLQNINIKNKKYIVKIKNLIEDYGRIWAAEETLFFFSLLFWSFIRGFQPDIHGLEKYMDYGFVNSILRSRFFPPLDMWMSGKTINYYYFGHLVSAVLTKLSGFTSAITYNLLIATTFALCFTAAFSLASNLVSFFTKEKKFIILGGLLSAFLLSLGGNWQHLWYFIKNRTFTGYWYPDATRFIIEKFGAADNTIHEFPIYSFVVADLHGHLLDLAFVLLFLALVLTIVKDNSPPARPAGGFSIRHVLMSALLLAVVSMTNFWDLPIYLLVLGLVLLWLNWSRLGFTFEAFLKTASFIFLCLLLITLFSLPFHLNFESIAQGVGLVDFHSPIWMLFFLWGSPLVITASFLVFLFKKKRKKTDYFVLLLLLVSWFLIIIPEIVYVKDIYIHSYQRANTVFKLTYQSFVMFSLSSGYIIVRVLSSLKKGPAKIYFSFFLFLFTLVMIYPYFAIKSYYGLKKYQGLDGLKYLATLYPDDYQAISWLSEEVAGQPVVLEASGDSYTDFARVSANTGMPTVAGWAVHEWLWRGSYDEIGKRREEVRKIYEEESLDGTKNLLKKYHVDYVFLGALERKEYKNLNEEKFENLGKVIFQEGETKIYQLEISH